MAFHRNCYPIKSLNSKKIKNTGNYERNYRKINLELHLPKKLLIDEKTFTGQRQLVNDLDNSSSVKFQWSN